MLRHLVLLILLVHVVLLPSLATAEGSKPFHRALILAGTGLNVPLTLGFLDGVSAAGQTPDVVIGACGGAITAAIINSIPDKQARYDYVRSRKFYNLLRNLNLRDITLVEFFKQIENLRWVAGVNMEDPPSSRMVPQDIFSFSLLPISNELDQSGITGPFLPTGIRSVIVAARMDFQPSEAGQELPPDRKLYTETYFTDPDTARFISGVKSFTGANFPLSAMNTSTEVVSHVGLTKAVRASIAEPLLASPSLIDGSYYMGAASDLNPIYLARALADEVIARKPTQFNSLFEVPGIEAVFGFDPNKVSAKVSEVGVDRWIDVPEGTYPSLSPDAQVNVWGAIHSLNPARVVKLASLVPDSYEGYLKVFDAQYKVAFKGAYLSRSALKP